jgi:type VI secretion system protein ImpH
LGLGGDILREGVKNPYPMLRYTGLMTQFPRSAEGLRTILADSLFNQNIHVVQFVERTVDIPQEQRFALGISGSRLGEDAYLGVEITERMGKFRIRVGPLSSEDFSRFLPDKSAFYDLKTLVRFYLDQPLAWDLEAVLRPEETVTTQLGGPRWSRLGWNTWLFSDGCIPENTAVRFNGTELH